MGCCMNEPKSVNEKKNIPNSKDNSHAKKDNGEKPLRPKNEEINDRLQSLHNFVSTKKYMNLLIERSAFADIFNSVQYGKWS